MGLGPKLGLEIFPSGGAQEFRLRFRAPDGTHFDATEKYALGVLDVIEEHIGAEKVDLTLGYVGTIPSSFPINAVYQWSRGPEEGILRIALRHGSGIDTELAKEELRVAVRPEVSRIAFLLRTGGHRQRSNELWFPDADRDRRPRANLDESRAYIADLQQELAGSTSLRDMQIAQSLDYPTVTVDVNREMAAYSGTSASKVARSVVAATSSTRFSCAKLLARSENRHWLPSAN